VFPVNVEMPRAWPSERQTGPRPRSGRCNSRGSRAGERSEQAHDPRKRPPLRTDRGAVASSVPMRVGGDAIDVGSRQRGISHLAEDRDSYGSNCEPNATAPRSARLGMRFRGSRTCSLRSPARDPRLLHRPLRGRGHYIDRSAVADSLARDPRLLRKTAVRWHLHSTSFIAGG